MKIEGDRAQEVEDEACLNSFGVLAPVNGIPRWKSGQDAK